MTVIWEMYEIHPTLPSKVRHLGNWNAKQGIQYEEPRKWIRRQNLEVCREIQNSSKTNNSYLIFQGARFKIISVQRSPWVKAMKNKADGEENIYEFSGPLPDVWFALQVSKEVISRERQLNHNDFSSFVIPGCDTL